MDSLPTELLLKIMPYLPPEDRMSCSLTCRRWAEAMTCPRLLDDVWLDIAGSEIEAATPVLVKSQRQYTTLRLYRAYSSEFDSEFWRKVGASLRVLELSKCSWSAHLFYAVLQQCPKLESLRIVNGRHWNMGIHDFVPPEGARLEELRDSLSHIRHLHLNIDVTAKNLDLLLGLMPNVTSLFLSPTSAVKPDFMDRLPSILKRNRVTRIGANFQDRLIKAEEIIKFVEITSGSLEELRIRSCELSRRACDTIVKCTKLRRLALVKHNTSFDNSHLEELVSNSLDLEILELQDIYCFGDERIAHLLELKKLRTLALGERVRVIGTQESLCRLGEISTLVKLDLTGPYVDSRVIRGLRRLENLQSLILGHCVDSECFEAICEILKRLTELDLGNVENLTDSDLRKLSCFKGLRSLRFTDGLSISDFTFERGVGSRAMKSLSIERCSITDAGLVSIASHHDRLKNWSLIVARR